MYPGPSGATMDIKWAEGLLCTFTGCDEPIRSATLCKGHYEQRRKSRTLVPLSELMGPGLCSVGCGNAKWSKGMCTTHYFQERREQGLIPAPSKSSPSRENKDWTVSELLVASRKDLSDKQVAELTGRTVRGVELARLRLRQAEAEADEEEAA